MSLAENSLQITDQRHNSSLKILFVTRKKMHNAYVAYWYDIRTKIKLLVGSNLFGGKEESERVGTSVHARNKQPENIHILSTLSQRQRPKIKGGF